MASLSKVRVEEYDIDSRLSELGLDREAFVNAAREGWAAFVACSPNHPATFPGTSAWAETIRSIRESLTPRGWSRRNEANLPLVMNPAGTMAITVASGDEDTGKLDGSPRTRSRKGPQTRSAVNKNNQQLGLFDFMEQATPIVESIKVPGRSTFLFLVHRDLLRSELRYELSQPISMTEDGCVDAWAERILFPADPIDPEARVFRNDDGGSGQSPEINVEIRKLG